MRCSANKSSNNCFSEDNDNKENDGFEDIPMIDESDTEDNKGS